jgi:secondary thiamine-phosphate synthase enzyme
MTKITASILSDLRESGVQEGIAVVWSPHTTAGITVNENADPDVVHDMLYGFEKAIPPRIRTISTPRATPTRT